MVWPENFEIIYLFSEFLLFLSLKEDSKVLKCIHFPIVCVIFFSKQFYSCNLFGNNMLWTFKILSVGFVSYISFRKCIHLQWVDGFCVSHQHIFEYCKYYEWIQNSKSSLHWSGTLATECQFCFSLNFIIEYIFQNLFSKLKMQLTNVNCVHLFPESKYLRVIGTNKICLSIWFKFPQYIVSHYSFSSRKYILQYKLHDKH